MRSTECRSSLLRAVDDVSRGMCERVRHFCIGISVSVLFICLSVCFTATENRTTKLSIEVIMRRCFGKRKVKVRGHRVNRCRNHFLIALVITCILAEINRPHGNTIFIYL